MVEVASGGAVQVRVSQPGPSKGPLVHFGDVFGCLNWGWWGYWHHQWMKARDVVEHLSMRRIVCANRDLAQNINSADIEKAGRMLWQQTIF